MNDSDFARLKRQIQKNCDISDANYSGLYSLCGLMLRLRDLYKWEHGLLPWQEPEPGDLLEWVDHREKRWERVAEEEFGPLTIGDTTFEPFDIEEVNRRLRPLGLIYGAGYVGGMKPSFFLGKAKESRRVGALRIDIVERELVRDLFVTPAMRQGDQIFASRSAMLFFLWDQILEMRPSTREALRFALAQYGLDADAIRRSPRELGPQLQQVGSAELETWIYHEIGEVHEDGFDGHLWHELVSTYANSPVEIFVRVVKDLLADTNPEGLLGHIIAHRKASSLAFYTVFMRAFTRAVFPEMKPAFQQFMADGDWADVEETRALAYSRAYGYARALATLHEQGRSVPAEETQQRILAELIEPLGVIGSLGEEDEEA